MSRAEEPSPAQRDSGQGGETLATVKLDETPPLDDDPSLVVDEKDLDTKDAATQPVTPDESARLILVFSSLLMFFFTIMASFVAAVVGNAETWERVSEVLHIAIPVESLIIGGAVAYYFKSQP